MAKSSKSAAPAPVSIGSSTVTSSDQQPNASAGKGPDLPREPMVLDWDPQNLGEDAAFAGEHGVGNDPTTDTQTSKRGKKESRQAGEATVEDSGDEIDWEQARHDRRFPSNDDEALEAGGAEGDGARAPATAEEKRSRAEKREAVLKALARQKSNLGAENAARDARAAADAAAKRASDAEERIKKASTGTLAERLAFIGLSRGELTDAVIMNGGELEAAAKDNGASNAEVSALRTELAALKTQLLADKKAEQDRATAQSVAQSRERVAELIKDEPVPLVRSLKAHDRVLDGAWQAWKASGKAGAISDYVPAAAEIIEEQLEKENPDLAALKKGARAATKDDEPAINGRADRKVSKPSVGRRTGPSRAANRRDSLEGVTDGHERDRIITREMGWTT